ncbi:hypothetical protein PsYK624_060220 [Phanerochaete sordida]|uniref:Uncharacterized protein n=1 Tax=Phanerochaete sordida TaxID=48140 RepID=A0A9P3G9I5_9APHY|nr:hypothetical protein PsYK624_060220 [Phanerochaete sordida]
MPIVPLPKTFADEYAQGRHVPQLAQEVIEQGLVAWGFVSEDPQESLLFHGTTFAPLPTLPTEDDEAVPLNDARNVDDYIARHALKRFTLQRRASTRHREFVKNAQARKAEASQIASSVLDALAAPPQSSATTAPRKDVSTWWDRNPAARNCPRPFSALAIVDGDLSDYESESYDVRSESAGYDYESNGDDYESATDDHESESDGYESAADDVEYALARAGCTTPALTTDDESYVADEPDADVRTPAPAAFAVPHGAAAKGRASTRRDALKALPRSAPFRDRRSARREAAWRVAVAVVYDGSSDEENAGGRYC